MDQAFLITTFATLFVIIDPIGLSPIFVALTQGVSAKARRAIAARACGIAALVLTMFAFFGEAVLEFIGISMPAFQIAGGILLFLTALDMLFERRTERRAAHGEDEVADDPSVFPIAIPLIAGPGSIATIILLTGQTSDWVGMVSVLGVMVVVVALVMALFVVSGVIERALGRTGITVVTRVLGMLLAALSVQFVLDGLQAFGVALP